MNFKVGDNVYAKINKYGFWPSRILKCLDRNKYEVEYYGDHLK